jgi:hypothetical protein
VTASDVFSTDHHLEKRCRRLPREHDRVAHAMASVLGPGSLSLAELYAARLDGELFSVDERFSPVDEADTAWLRATALRSVTGTRMIAEVDSALWIHGLRALPPAVHTMCVARSDRIKFPPSRRFVLREVTHSPGDVAEVAGLRVTVPARILYDLAFAEQPGTPGSALALLARWPELCDTCARRIADAPNLPGKGMALRRLAEWNAGADAVPQAQPALARYTS